MRAPKAAMTRKSLVFVVHCGILLVACGCSQQNRSVRMTEIYANPASSGEFTLAVIPDTQCYTSKGGIDVPAACGQQNGPGQLQMLTDQFSWISANHAVMRIPAVLGLGDIVNCGATDWEWDDALTAYKILDDSGVPYSPMLGNHDYDYACTSGIGNREASHFNGHFNYGLFSSRPWFGPNTYPASSMDNFFITFTAEGRNYLVLALELFPRDAALNWAQAIIDAHADYDVIVTTHAYLVPNSSRYGANDVQGPVDLNVANYNDGQQLWDKLLRKNKNIIAVLSGHVGGATRRTDTGDNGNLVVQMQSDYQFEAQGGSGYFRLLRFNPANRTITVFTYSPYLGRYLSDSTNYFTVQY